MREWRKKSKKGRANESMSENEWEREREREEKNIGSERIMRVEDAFRNN